MNKFKALLNGLTYSGKVDTEIDDFGNINSFEFSNSGIDVKYKKGGKRNELKKYNRTGIHTLGTTYPNPCDREELLEREYKNSNWYTSNAAVIVITILAIIVDFCCYINLFELAVGYSGKVGIMEMLAALGAAAAIDLLPIFFAHNLHRNSLMKRLEKNGHIFGFEKQVLLIFTIFNAILFVAIVTLMTVTRLLGLTPDRAEFWINLIISLIPLATSMVCFILGYLSYNPAKKKLKELNTIKLFLQENINESRAMIEEVKAQPDPYETLKRQDESQYDAAYALIEELAEGYKSYVRQKIVPYFESPADTTDLTARRARVIYSKIKFPLNFDAFYAYKTATINSCPPKSVNDGDSKDSDDD